MDVLSDEKTLVKVILVFALFVVIVVSGTVGLALLGFGVLYAVLLYGEKNSVFQMSKGRSYDFIKTTTLALALVAGFLFVSAGLFSVINSTPFDAFSTVRLLSAQQGVPITINSPIIKELIWGIVIPILESLFFLGVIGKQLARYFGVSGLDLRSNKRVQTILVIAMVGASATLFHLAADVTTDAALLSDFLFFSFSMAITLRLGEMKQAAGMHIVVNTISTLKSLGVLAVFGL